MSEQTAVREQKSQTTARGIAEGGGGNDKLRLTRLTLNGFKSFADKTEFHFDEPITGIVGPNGCGKSNIVDAIKWVLGERSSKSLRGKEMIDVIFAGSAGRKPSGMASVTLSFDNPVIDQVIEATSRERERAEHGQQLQDEDHSLTVAAREEGNQEEHPSHDKHVSDVEADHARQEGESEAAAIIDQRGRVRRSLPIDADTVEVERRLYRDGKSQYLINGRIARLRDIRDLFLDTGIGADAYSIIEQGKVDAMLLASPTERRAIFEEAAGIAKYRKRRVEAERKLDRTETNLVRTRDQLASTERRLRIVRGQAAKARRFEELDGEYRALRTALAFEQYDEIRQRLDGLTSQLTQLVLRKNETAATLAQAEAAHQDAEIERAELARNRRTVEDELTTARHESEQATQRKAMAERSIEETARQVEGETKRLAEATERIEALDMEIEDLLSAIAAIGERLGDSERSLESLASERAQAQEAITAKRSDLGEARARAEGIERERLGLCAQVEADQRRGETIAQQLTGIVDRIASLATERAAVGLAMAGDESTLKQHRFGAESLRQRIGGLTRSAESLGQDRGQLAGEVGELDERFVRLDSRRLTLREMVESRAGLGEAARHVLGEAESGGGFTGVIGSLAELIETDAQHASALEAALGADLEAIVVRSMAEMPSGNEIQSLPGRVTFLPIEPLGRRGLGDASVWEQQTGGRVRALRGLVRCRRAGQLDRLLDRLLGQTAMVEHIDAALMLAAGPMAGWRFVTRDGAVLEPDGRVVAGPPSGEGSGLISRRSELIELETELVELERRLGVERTRLETADAEAARIEAARTELAADLAEVERNTVRTEAQLERRQTDRQRLVRDAQGFESEGESLRVRLGGVQRDRRDLIERAERLERLGIDQRALVEQYEAELTKGETSLASMNEHLASARVAVGRLSEQIGASKKEVGRLERQRDDAERARDEAERQTEHARQRSAHHEQTAREAGEIIETAAASQAGLAERVGAFDEQQATVTQRVSDLAQHVTHARNAARIHERDWHSVETSRREMEVKRENIEERTSDEITLDLGAEYAEYRELMAPGDVTRIDTHDAAARVNVLRGEIKKLGQVNLDAIAEEGNLAERNEDLIAQVRDIDEARIKLATLIEKLNIASRDRFGEVFERIKGEFGGRDGMFRRLFGGGRAEVRLMGLVKTDADGRKIVTDEIDLLESGIEVIAKPPGKEPRSISQLSGGEKTLTAVALLMSIFRSKPSCFCILDEVDAALDEGNVARFCATIEQFTDMSRFIVITHNKRTMQSLDLLFGVTMQERGVSKKVKVKFDQVREDGRIDKAALKASEPEQPRPTGKLREALASMREGSESSVPAS